MTNTDALKKHLLQLHEELDAIDEIDDETRVLLEALRDDLERVTEGEDIGDRARDAAREFAAEHPRLASVLERVAETLSSMGI